jgi:hypothetical protein
MTFAQRLPLQALLLPSQLNNPSTLALVVYDDLLARSPMG